ncbi:MAG: GNAT family N-acetyltransferase [Clostridia bacterium]|nr:GNAT family N-acetyltransferase [Clostridia bacterium]
MTINEYQKLAMRTLNPQLSKRDVLINGVMGLCGEAGEAIDIVKKHLAQGHELDRDKLIKELGDVAWYLAETAHALDVPLEAVLEGNIAKLRARYPQGFAAEKSLLREDDWQIKRADISDADEIYALYRSLMDMPHSTWDEEYPSKDIVEHDLQNEVILIMRDHDGKIIAAIAVCDDEEDFDDASINWYKDVSRFGCLARLGVDKQHQGKGIAKKMLLSAMDLCREKGCDAVRFLVSKSNPAPQRAYAKLNFDICGEVNLYEHQWLCYQKRL